MKKSYIYTLLLSLIFTHLVLVDAICNTNIDMKYKVEKQEKANYTISFTVKNSHTNTGIANAKIQLMGPEYYELFTNSSGFAQATVAEGYYNYAIRETGYFDQVGSLFLTGNTSRTINMVPYKTLTINIDPEESGAIVLNSSYYSESQTFQMVAGQENTVAAEALPGYQFIGWSGDLSGTETEHTLLLDTDKTITAHFTETLYLITFNVSDGTSAVADANIYIDDQYMLTNSDGVATISLTNGTYNYQVTANGFNQIEGTITVNNENLTQIITLEEAAYTATFLVTDGTSGLMGATIKINNTSMETDNLGMAVFGLDAGIYQYIITNTGYTSQAGSFEIIDENITRNIIMSEGNQIVTFNISDGENAIEGIPVQINNQTIVTDADGVATIELGNGAYFYEIDHPSYEEHSDIIVIEDLSISIDVELTELIFDITFHTTHEESTLSLVYVQLGNINIHTDYNGNATFQLTHGTYNFLATKDGFNPIAGTITIFGSDSTINISLTESSATYYPAKFSVSSHNQTIANASIKISDTILVTDRKGLAYIGLKNGTHALIATKENFDTIVESVTVADMMILKDIELVPTNPETVPCIFYVMNEHAVLTEAQITINNQVLNTQSTEATTFALQPGIYDYTVAKEGYNNEIGQLTVELNTTPTGHAYMTPIANPLHEITFSVNDGENPISEATISMNGIYKTTSLTGEATFNLPAGTYNYTIQKDSYMPLSASVNVSTSLAIDQTLTLIDTYVASFTVSNQTNVVSGITIKIDNQNIITDNEGMGTCILQPGTYLYTITHDSYAFYYDAIVISNANVDVPIFLVNNQITYPITFTISNSGIPIGGAVITIDNETITTTPDGIATIWRPSGTYAYTVNADGYETISGNVSVENNSASINVEMTEIENLTQVAFSVTDGTNPIENAQITIDSQVYFTNSNGEYSVELLSGTYLYTVAKSGYELYENEITVIDMPIDENIILTEITVPMYEIVFSVTDGIEALSDVYVTVQGLTQLTTAEGITTFNLPDETYSYTATKTGYVTLTGTITVDGAPTTENITMETLPVYRINFGVTGNSSPVQDAIISINETEITTDNQGFAAIDVLPGTYAYTVNHTGYEPYTGTIDVINEDVYKTVVLTPLTIEAKSYCISVYPNPTRDFIHLNFEGEAIVSVFSIDGQLLMHEKTEHKTLDLSHFQGNYFILRIAQPEVSYTTKVILLR